MKERAIDCYSPLTPQVQKDLVTSGYEGAIRYLGAHTMGWPKGLTPEELKGAKEAGLEIAFNWEGMSTSRAYFTEAQGESDARNALAELEWLGVPLSPDVCVYFSVDFDAWEQPDFDAVDSYFMGVEKVFGDKLADGVYGGILVIEYLRKRKSKAQPKKFWQTQSWSDGEVDPKANLYQQTEDTTVDGVSVDIDIVKSDPDWYPPAGPKYKKTVVLVGMKRQRFAALEDNGKVYVLWSAAQLVGGTVLNLGDGNLRINGTDVKAVTYKDQDYVLWTQLNPGHVKGEKLVRWHFTQA